MPGEACFCIVLSSLQRLLFALTSPSPSLHVVLFLPPVYYSFHSFPPVASSTQEKATPKSIPLKT